MWDALRSDRPYRPAWSEEEARSYIREQAGKSFDPQVVEAFLKADLGTLNPPEVPAAITPPVGVEGM